jgi:hypothetical protein
VLHEKQKQGIEKATFAKTMFLSFTRLVFSQPARAA